VAPSGRDIVEQIIRLFQNYLRTKEIREDILLGNAFLPIFIIFILFCRITEHLISLSKYLFDVLDFQVDLKAGS
jgi:hypothetical protein